VSVQSDDYRRRLLPNVARWTADNARVAIFGIGPHTDVLFDVVPELARVRIVGYVVSQVGRPAPRYRGQRVHPLAWAARHADVVLCSSFVSETAMAALADPLPCKVVMSHTDRVPTGEPAPRPGVTFRPSAVGRRIAWPGAPCSAMGRYLEHSQVLDAIIETMYPFVARADVDLARAIVRYVTPGMRAVEIGGASPQLTALLARCAAPGGDVVRCGAEVTAAQLRPLVGPGGLRVLEGRTRDAAGSTVVAVRAAADDTGAPPASSGHARARRRATSQAQAPVDVALVHLGRDAGPILEAWCWLAASRPVLIVALRPEVPVSSIAGLQARIDRAGYHWRETTGPLRAHEPSHTVGPAVLVAVPRPHGEAVPRLRRQPAPAPGRARRRSLRRPS
jgi:hypothetical protein